MYAKSKFFMFFFTVACLYIGFMYLSGLEQCHSPPSGVNEFICVKFGHVSASIMPLAVGLFSLYRLIEMIIKK